MNLLRKILSHRYTLILFLILVAIWFCAWAFNITIAPASSLGAPDEGLRYLIPKFIFENWRLPTGYDTATIHSMGYWSYAFYPQFLGPLASAGFMAIGSLFNSNPEFLVHAARIASVTFGVTAVLFIGLSVKKLFKGDKNANLYGFVAMLLFATWPQVAFLSAYVNNDIVGLCGVSIIMYACIAGRKDRWSTKNTTVLVLGLVVCLLGYTNSYGFVLFGVIFFIISLWWQVDSRKYFLKLTSVVVVGVLIFAGPFFLRNAIIYNGDIFGLVTFGERTMQWERETGTEAQRSYRELTGKGISDLVISEGYRKTQTESTVARFGKMTIAPDEKYTSVYRHMIQIGIFGFTLMIVLGVIRHLHKGSVMSDLRHAIARRKYDILFIGCIMGACAVTIALSLYYTLAIDYQAQGRYIVYLLIPLVISSVLGFSFLINEYLKRKARVPIVLLLVGYYLLTSLIIYYKYVFLVRVV